MQAAAAQLAEAETAFKKAGEIAPNDSRPFAALGNFYWASSRFAEAEKAFLKAVELDPKNKLANRTLASFYMVTRRPQDAERFLRAVAAEGNVFLVPASGSPTSSRSITRRTRGWQYFAILPTGRTASLQPRHAWRLPHTPTESKRMLTS